MKMRFCATCMFVTNKILAQVSRTFVYFHTLKIYLQFILLKIIENKTELSVCSINEREVFVGLLIAKNIQVNYTQKIG